jgi:hypothetical protein
MLFFQDEGGALASGPTGWLPEATFALLFVLVALALAGVALLWLIVGRLRALEGRAAVLERIEDIQASLARLLKERDDLDLRRMEHLLVDLRETQERLEDALLRTVEGAHARSETQAIVPHGPEDVGERIVNRLLALGFERVQIVTRSEKLVELAQSGGEVLVEARRQGVLHKGRVVIRGGRISDVEVHPAYSIFP